MLTSSSGFKPAWQSGWAKRAATDSRFDAETIVRIIAAGDPRSTIAEVCASEGISLDTYYVWKLKYAGLTVVEVQHRRSQDRAHLRRTALVVRAVLLIAAGGAVAALAPWTVASTSRSTTTLLRDEARGTAPMPATPTPATPTALSPAGLHVHTRPPVPQTVAENKPRTVASVNATDVNVEPRPDPGGYRVQVVASPDAEEAQAWVDRLRGAGYGVQLTTTHIDRIQMYRVRVGPLRSRQEAEEVARRLEREGYPSPWLVQ